MNGILTKNEDGIWVVKWSDLHSFGHGTHWIFTKLSTDSNSIKYVKDNLIKYEPLKEEIEVEFELVISGFDETYHTPINTAKLIFPKVDEFEKEGCIKEYIENGGDLWSFNEISTIRDGGTVILMRKSQSKLSPFYLHKDHFTLHDGYPTTTNNLVTDKLTQIYVLDKLQCYKRDCEQSLKNVNKIIDKIIDKIKLTLND